MIIVCFWLFCTWTWCLMKLIRTTRGSEDKTQVRHMQDKCPTYCTITPVSESILKIDVLFCLLVSNQHAVLKEKKWCFYERKAYWFRPLENCAKRLLKKQKNRDKNKNTIIEKWHTCYIFIICRWKAMSAYSGPSGTSLMQWTFLYTTLLGNITLGSL